MFTSGVLILLEPTVQEIQFETVAPEQVLHE